MSFKDCIDNGEAEGVIPKERADRARADYDQYHEQLRLDYGPDAAAEAARRVFAEIEAEAARRRRLKLLQAEKAGALGKLQQAFTDLQGRDNPGEFMVNVIEDIGGKAGTSTVNGRYKAVLGRAHGLMQAAITKFERDALGRTRNRAALEDVVREAFGRDTGSAEAKALAAAWGEAAEMLRRRFNAAGGEIGKLEDWGMPQMHDAISVARAGRDEWKRVITPMLDRERMIDRTTGQPFTDEKLSLALDEAYETIRTNGWVRRTPGFGGGAGKSLANQRADHRFLIFRDADDWLAYQSRFGDSDPFAAMMHHLDQLARDVASLEILGPNPRATLTYLGENAQRLEALKGTGEGGARAAGPVRQARTMYDLFVGAQNVPVNAKFARAVGATRDYLTSAMLGSASLSAVTDIKTQRIARVMAGSRNNGVIRDIVRTLSPADPEHRRLAIRSGLIAEGAAQHGMAYARYFGELNARGFTRWLADSTLRWSGLSPFTQAGRWAFGMEMLGNLADRAGRSIADLEAGDGADQRFVELLRRHQLDGAWDEIRATAPYEPEKGAKFIRPEDIAAREDLLPGRADHLADRVLEMIAGETEFAVPTASLRGRAILAGPTRPGSVARELLNSVAQFKSFPTTVMYLLHTRTMQERRLNGDGSAAMYAAGVIFGMTLYGALAVQLKNVANGRDPQDMTDPRFWGAATIQGGGLGIMGDFLFASESRAGTGLSTTLAGPLGGFAGDTLSLTVGNVAQAVRGEETRAGRDAVRYARRYTPAFSSLWYARAAYNRMVLDNLQRLADPEADQYFRRQRRNRQRNFGNDFYWSPGETLPERAPAIDAMAGVDG